jgi:hypothetical protein
MFLLGLLVATCFIPGYVGAAVPTQWALLSIVLPFSLWRSGVLNLGHFAGLAVLAWSAISILWAPNPWDAGYGLWIAGIWALSFWLGTTMSYPVHLWQGLAAGLSISSVVAIFQHFGYQPVVMAGESPAGLLFNSTLLGACCALVLIALWTQRQWLWMPGLLPGLYLANSRGAYLILVLVAIAHYSWKLALTLLVLGGFFLIYWIGQSDGDSDAKRLVIFGATFRASHWLGNGIGSFNTFYILLGNEILYPGRAHNDYLQLWFELGIGSIPIFLMYLLNLRNTRSDHWPIFLAFSLLGLFYFPLWAPVSAFMGCLTAGIMFADRHQSWLLSSPGRYSSLSGSPLRQPIFSQLGRHAVPTIPST